MSYWKYLLSYLKEITFITVNYSLITQSGETILEIEEKEVPKSAIYCECGAYEQYEIARRLRQKPEIKKKYDERAEQILDQYQKKNRNQIKNGYLDGGDYIVKCTWYIDLSTEDLTYEEFKKFNGEII